MSIMIKTRQAYSEIDEFLGLLSEEQRNEIPKKLRDFFKEEKDQEYFKNIDKDIPIKDQNLKEETLAIIALLNLQYWCKDEEEKKRLQEIYAQNEKEYQDILYEKYNPNDIFKKKEETTIENNNKIKEKMQMVEYKDPVFKRIINKILNFLHLR
ncbi:MAG: hypothetical protein HP028_07420 [Clostridia bacterium]|nr:hypothetical protein [Clostridia bacterium]